MARATKLTPELQERICNALRAGNFIEPVCAVNGINPATFHRWMKAGEDAPGKPARALYRNFRKAVEAAQSQPEVVLVNRTYRDAIGAPVVCGHKTMVECPCGCGHVFEVECENRIHVNADQRAREFLLSRKFPDRWGGRDRIEHSGPGGGPIQTTTTMVRFGGRYRKDGVLKPADPAAGSPSSGNGSASGA